MAKAELAAPYNMVEIKELCRQPGCTCREAFEDLDPDLVKLGEIVVAEDEIVSPLIFSNPNLSCWEISISGVLKRSEVKDAVDGCDGPITLENGEKICGALETLADTLTRKRRNGREEV